MRDGDVAPVRNDGRQMSTSGDKLAAVFNGDPMTYLGFTPDPIQLGYRVHYFSLV
jgi:hypothetical protein